MLLELLADDPENPTRDHLLQRWNVNVRSAQQPFVGAGILKVRNEEFKRPIG
jgi:hypothetical protein